jgi:hypothetical protein
MGFCAFGSEPVLWPHSACGSMVRYDRMFVVFALCERKKRQTKKRKYRSAEGKEAPTA